MRRTEETGMNTHILDAHYPRLVRDYILDKGGARSFFRFSPDMKGVMECIEVRKESSVSENLYTILKRQNSKHGADQRAMENIEHLREPGCATVVTGQQIGLFGGPLYVTYKILKTLHTADAVRESSSRPVVPVFWIGTNDHDAEEISHAAFFDRGSSLRQLRYETDSDPGLSCGRIPVGPSLQELVREFAGNIRTTEFTQEIVTILSESYSDGKNLGSAFFDLAVRLYSRLGIVILDPSDKEFMNLIRPVLEKECGEFASVSEKVFTETAEKVSAERYHVQVNPERGRLHAFLDDNGIRKPLFYDNGKVRDGKGNRIDSVNSRLSTHVLSRNLCQDYVLNTAAYVAGPGEISYCALLRDLYEMHGLIMPVILPRYMGTLVDRSVQRSLKALKTGVEHFILNPHDRAVHEIFSDETDIDFSALRQDFEERADRFTEEILKRLPGESGQEDYSNVSSLNKMIKSQLNRISGTVRKREKKRAETDLRRASEASDMLLPGGNLQERVLNIFQFMNFYGGAGFVEELSGLIRGSEEGHTVWNI